MTDSLFPIDVAYLTDTGRVRDTNEDSLSAIVDWGVFAVADGVGGLSAGDVASRKVCELLADTCDTFRTVQPLTTDFINNRLRGAIKRANHWIRSESEHRDVRGMGTTLVLFSLDPQDPSRGISLHAGDSRLYRLRDGKFKQLTVDHSIAGQLGVDESELHPYMQGVITRAVGIQPEVHLEETAVEVQPGDLFLVCSDGLTRMIPDPELQRLIEEENGSLQHTANLLVDRANDAGGYDNITLILVRVGE